MHASFANIPFSCRVASVRLKNRLLYIHPGNIVLILKILKKNVVSFKEFSVSENKERSCKKKMFSYEGLACCHMTSTSIATTCDFIVWFFLKYCFSAVSDSILIRRQREFHLFRLPSF